LGNVGQFVLLAAVAQLQAMEVRGSCDI
jgi:hypothetical protein